MPLRPLRASDLPALAGWLPRVAEEAGCERWASEVTLRDAPGTVGALLFHDARGEAFVSYQTGAPLPDSVRVDLLAVAPGQRRLGSGSRAALALERRLARTTGRVYVPVPSSLGLALYFWLRLGYRPLTQREWPATPQSAPAAWLVRDLR